MTALSSLIFVCGFVVYGVTVARGRTLPSANSWAVWGAISFSNAFVCLLLNSDIAGSAIALTDAACVASVLFLVFRRTGFATLSGTDIGLMVFAAAASLLAFVNPELSTVLVQIPLLLAARPTLSAALRGEEQPVAWAFWTAGLAMNLVMTSGTAFAWVYPITMFALHFCVMCAALVPRARTSALAIT